MTYATRLFRSAAFALVVGACGEEASDTSSADSSSSDGTTMSTTTMSTTTMSTTTMSSTTTTTGASEDTSSSEGTASDSSSSTAAESESGTTGAGLSFEQDVWPMLEMVRDPPLSGRIASCNGCHATGAGGLSMPDVATAYTNLLDAPSSSALCAGSLRVVAGDPDASCFVNFYEMRLRDQLGWVDMAETDVVRAWVESGAAP